MAKLSGTERIPLSVLCSSSTGRKIVISIFLINDGNNVARLTQILYFFYFLEN